MYNRNTYFCMQINILYTKSEYVIWYMLLQSIKSRFYTPNFERITITLCHNLWKHSTYCKYLLEEYINKSLVSPHVTTMLFASVFLTVL